MNIKYFQNILLIFLGIILMNACKREDILLQKDGSTGAPTSIMDVVVKNLPGAAKITYTIPKDPNLLYVKAVYEIQPGIIKETKSSRYIDTLTVTGFGDTLEHEVKLYSVGSNDNASEPLVVKVNPLIPPVKSVFKSINLDATFSGAYVQFKNPSEADLALVMLTDSTGNGDWAMAQTYYTASPEGNFIVRGFDSTKRKFAVYVRDRWGNKSDTLAKILKPYYEELVDKSKFKEVDLETDTYLGNSWGGVSARNMTYLWNNTWNSGNDVFHTKPSDPKMPQWFTFDMGAKYKLSRFKFYHRASPDAYTGADPEIFEIYGSNDPDTDGGWTNWHLLGQFHSVKPTPGTTVTSEDLQFACIDGEDFNFPEGLDSYRYLRWKTLKTWGNAQFMFISELTLWGTPVN